MARTRSLFIRFSFPAASARPALQEKVRQPSRREPRGIAWRLLPALWTPNRRDNSRFYGQVENAALSWIGWNALP
jgi:hypothetical protein